MVLGALQEEEPMILLPRSLVSLRLLWEVNERKRASLGRVENEALNAS